MTSLLPMLELIDVAHDIELALALRRVGRERRQERSRKGWETRWGVTRFAGRSATLRAEPATLSQAKLAAANGGGA